MSADVGPCQQCHISVGQGRNVRVAVEISFVVATQADVSCNRLISKYFRFSGSHIGFLVGARYRLKAPSCSQFIFRKSRQCASTNSKLFRNVSEKGSGVISPHAPGHGRVKYSLLSYHHFLLIRSFDSHIAPQKSYL